MGYKNDKKNNIPSTYEQSVDIAAALAAATEIATVLAAAEAATNRRSVGSSSRIATI